MKKTVASRFSSIRMEERVTNKVSSCINKHRGRHLSLAARIVVANSLILTTLWYLLTLWARKLSFFAKIQCQLDTFVWAGRARVNRNTGTQRKCMGGLGLLSVEEQYRAIAGNFMIWLLGTGDHLLRDILCTHIRDLSANKWGYSDLTWMVTKGGGRNPGGSTPWQNICKAWEKLKPRLSTRKPCNLMEWAQLPLWRPHCNHRVPDRVKCSTRAQHSLRNAGLVWMKDVLSPGGGFLAWRDLPENIRVTGKERAYLALLANLEQHPTIDPAAGTQQLAFAETNPPQNQRIWLYEVTQQDAAADWDQITTRYRPMKMFVAQAGALNTANITVPGPMARPHRVLLRLPWGKGDNGSTFGP